MNARLSYFAYSSSVNIFVPRYSSSKTHSFRHSSKRLSCLLLNYDRTNFCFRWYADVLFQNSRFKRNLFFLCVEEGDVRTLDKLSCTNLEEKFSKQRVTLPFMSCSTFAFSLCYVDEKSWPSEYFSALSCFVHSINCPMPLITKGFPEKGN